MAPFTRLDGSETPPRATGRMAAVRRFVARFAISILVAAGGSMATAVYVVIYNGITVPRRLAAVERQQRADSLEGGHRQALQDSTARVVFWVGGLMCGSVTPEVYNASLDVCGMVANRTHAVFGPSFAAPEPRRHR